MTRCAVPFVPELVDEMAVALAVAGWAPVPAPCRMLRESLADAKLRLNEADETEPHAGWHRLRDADTEQARTAAANDLLTATLAGWRSAELHGRWRVGLIPQRHIDPAELAAVQALVHLVEADGWSRLDRCNRAGCERVFLDWTNSGRRRACRVHRPGPGPAGRD